MISILSEALPKACFSERHSLDIDGTPEQVWTALTELRWSELRVTTPLMWIRRLGGSDRTGERRPLEDGPARLMCTDPPAYAAAAAIGRPWRLRPEHGPDVKSLSEVRGFAEPGWLKYGMDFTVAAVTENRTRITTTTLCEPIDEQARRRFAPYWALIRPFSAFIRRDILAAIARRVRQATVTGAAPGQRVLLGPAPRFGLPTYVRAGQSPRPWPARAMDHAPTWSGRPRRTARTRPEPSGACRQRSFREAGVAQLRRTRSAFPVSCPCDGRTEPSAGRKVASSGPRAYGSRPRRQDLRPTTDRPAGSQTRRFRPYFNRRDIRRSARSLPPVWQVGQY